MLKLRRGVVVEAGEEAPVQRLQVDVDGELRPAIADTAMVGPSALGDEVVVNTEAKDLALGSGGFDVVHVNLTRGLAGEGEPGAHVMKLNYTSLQHAVLPVEETVIQLHSVGPWGVTLAQNFQKSYQVPVGRYTGHAVAPSRVTGATSRSSPQRNSWLRFQTRGSSG